MTQHTPGPWKANGPSIYAPNGIEKGGAFYDIAIGLHAMDDEGTANARLIAAAPDLYAIVRHEYDAYYGFKTLPLGYPPDRAKAIIAAIARAEGGAA